VAGGSISKEFDELLKAIDAIWHAVAKLEKKIRDMQAERKNPRESMLEPAWAVDITYRDDGNAMVRINESEPFSLPPKLARLLEILISGAGPAADGMSAWKPVDSVRRQMAGESGSEPLAARALNQLVYRLGRELRRNGFHSGLIQRDKYKRVMRLAAFVRARPG
jgi:hypothetical protein